MAGISGSFESLMHWYHMYTPSLAAFTLTAAGNRGGAVEENV